MAGMGRNWGDIGEGMGRYWKANEAEDEWRVDCLKDVMQRSLVLRGWWSGEGRRGASGEQGR